MQEYLLALSYFSALTIVCLVLYSFTYFLPTPDNANKAKSTFYFRLILLFTIAAFAAILLRYEDYHRLSLVLNNLFILIISYNLLFAVYTRYDHQITSNHYLSCTTHGLIFVGVLLYIDANIEFGFVRSAAVLINVSIPYLLTLKKCNQQFKVHRIGDRVLYGALLVIILIFVAYIAIYALFYTEQKQISLELYFISLLSFVCVLFFGFALSIIYSLVGKLRKEIITDKLTGAKNRNYLNEISQQLFSIAKRNKAPLSIVLCDIDRFKNINDTYGHSMGDKVLIEFSRLIKNSLRTEDAFIRIGGEEFVILLPHINIEHAHMTAERLRKIINKQSIEVDENQLTISASFGVAPIDFNKSIDNNIHNADIALYEAKRSGRNKVVVFNK